MQKEISLVVYGIALGMVLEALTCPVNSPFKIFRYADPMEQNPLVAALSQQERLVSLTLGPEQKNKLEGAAGRDAKSTDLLAGPIYVFVHPICSVCSTLPADTTSFYRRNKKSRFVIFSRNPLNTQITLGTSLPSKSLLIQDDEHGLDCLDQLMPGIYKLESLKLTKVKN